MTNIDFIFVPITCSQMNDEKHMQIQQYIVELLYNYDIVDENI